VFHSQVSNSIAQKVSLGETTETLRAEMHAQIAELRLLIARN
jgi:hypothetical protein